MVNWYIDKLQGVSEEEWRECVDIIDKIARLYGKTTGDYLHYIEEIRDVYQGSEKIL